MIPKSNEKTVNSIDRAPKTKMNDDAKVELINIDKSLPGKTLCPNL